MCPAGKLTDTRQRFLGTRPPRLFAVSVRGERSLLALSSRPWLGYSDMGRWQFMPLSYEALDHAAVSGPAFSACCFLFLSLSKFLSFFLWFCGAFVLSKIQRWSVVD
jgi:splicing factor 3B subunit 3